MGLGDSYPGIYMKEKKEDQEGERIPGSLRAWMLYIVLPTPGLPWHSSPCLLTFRITSISIIDLPPFLFLARPWAGAYNCKTIQTVCLLELGSCVA